MFYIATFILLFSALQLLVALANLVFLQTLAKLGNNASQLVSVLIPARNEEKNIAKLLTDLQKQDYKNIEILVFDDQSGDRTAQITTGIAQNDTRIRLLQSTGLPQGWLGKNHACHSLAKHARGQYYLFLDADVGVGNNIIRNTIGFATKHGLGLLSIFPMQKMQTWGEKITVPNMNFILLSLLPLVLVRKTPFPSLAAANGQFMLFNAETYRKTLPHKKMRISKVEDIETARYFKTNKIRVACLLGNPSISCRMYNGFKDAIYGFSKNVIQFFGGSFFVAITFWLIATFGFLAVWLEFPPSILVLYLLTLAATRAMVSVASKQPAIQNILLAIPQQITMGIFIYQAIINTFKKQYRWKERDIST